MSDQLAYVEHAERPAQRAGLSASIYIYIYEHEAIRIPKFENNIGAPLAPQKVVTVERSARPYDVSI